MDSKWESSIFSFQRSAYIIYLTSSLQSKPQVSPCMRYFSLWHRRSVSTQVPWWLRKTNWLCFPFIVQSRKELQSIRKEGLACVFGVKKFHSYLLGHSFKLITDHKPLTTFFHQHKPTSCQASVCIRRWSLQLAAYEYTIVFHGTRLHVNANSLSRLPLLNAPAEVPMEPELILLLQHLDGSPVTINDIHKWTKCDPLLAKFFSLLNMGGHTSVILYLHHFHLEVQNFQFLMDASCRGLE